MLDGHRSAAWTMGGADWYNAQPAIQPAIDALGSEEAGRAAFSRLQDFMGATSNVNPVPQNMRTASYYYWREKNGMRPCQTSAIRRPQPYGAMAQKTAPSERAEAQRGRRGLRPGQQSRSRRRSLKG